MVGATDFLGREIKAGDTVVYPVRRGSSMWLNKITVDLADEEHITGKNSFGRFITVRNLKNCVLVQPIEPSLPAITREAAEGDEE